MKVNRLHPWDIPVEEAMRIQRELSGRIVEWDDFDKIERIGGVDISFRGGVAKAAVVVMSFPELEVLDYAVEEMPVTFPYIPGLLSFRESPPLMAAFEKLETEPDLVIVDGQGIAHPRGLGIASHLGLILDKPTIGCAKSKLYGRHKEPGKKAGSIEYLYDNRGKIIGACVRTKDSVKPVYVSVGHRVSLETAIRIVLRCCRGYRLPEPTRYAHLIAGGARPPKKRKKEPQQLTLW